MHISGELCLLFFKLAAPLHVLFFKVARSPFKQKYGIMITETMGKLSETMEFSQIHYKRDYGQTLARRWESLSEMMGRPWRDDGKLKRLARITLVSFHFSPTQT